MASVVDKLNDLVQLDVDAIHAYDQAIEACEVTEIRTELERFKGDHERHVRDLSECVRNHGGVPKVEQDFKGFLIEGFTAIMSMGDRSALMAMRGNEELTNRTYKSCLDDADLPVDVRQICEKNYQDEQRHLAWIKQAIDTRLWERGTKTASKKNAKAA